MDTASMNGQAEGEAPPEPGFKRTKVGWIPEEWDMVRLESICDRISSGATPRRSNSEYFEGGDIPWVKTLDLTNGGVRSTKEKITRLAVEENSCDVLPRDTVLVAMYGGFNQIGRTGILKVKATTNQAVCALEIDESKVSPRYVLEWLNHRVRYWRRYAASSRKDPNIKQADVRVFPTALPPRSEQDRIADILITWDCAVEQINDLIAEKERRKKALMQQLLKGKTRVPGHSEDDWVNVKIGDLLKRVKRYVDWDDDAQYDLVSVKRGSEGLYHRESIYGREKKTKKLHTLKEGDFVISRMQVVHGATAYVTPEFEGMHVSNSYIILRSREGANIDTEFFAWLAKMPYMYHLAYLASHGVHIEKMTFKPKFYLKSKVKIPPTVEEQQEIVSILKTCEEEIEMLRDKREAFQRQKKGMMQKLLTGKIRVSTESTSSKVEA